MSFRNNPADSTPGEEYRRRALAKANVARAARAAGYKSPFRRLLDRLRPHRQGPGGDPDSDYGTTYDPPR